MSNSSISNSEILDKLRWRYATKAYDLSRTISLEDWELIEESLRLAPSSYGLQPYKFIVVNDKAIREKLKAAAWGQTQVTDASHLVVLAYKKTLDEIDVDKFVELVSESRGVTPESLAEYGNMMKGSVKKAVDGGYLETWNSRQAYIALGFLLETAALMGIDATPMEGFNPAQFNEILGLTDYSAVVLAAVGYRDEPKDWLAALPKVRFPKPDLIETI